MTTCGALLPALPLDVHGSGKRGAGNHDDPIVHVAFLGNHADRPAILEVDEHDAVSIEVVAIPAAMLADEGTTAELCGNWLPV